jgi:hypothetical protein
MSCGMCPACLASLGLPWCPLGFRNRELADQPACSAGQQGVSQSCGDGRACYKIAAPQVGRMNHDVGAPIRSHTRLPKSTLKTPDRRTRAPCRSHNAWRRLEVDDCFRAPFVFARDSTRCRGTFAPLPPARAWSMEGRTQARCRARALRARRLYAGTWLCACRVPGYSCMVMRPLSRER